MLEDNKIEIENLKVNFEYSNNKTLEECLINILT